MADVAAKAVSSLLLLSLLALFSSRFAGATEYVVGDDAGWRLDFNYDAWAQDKTFLVGDTLVFNYHAGYDAVAIVDGTGFRSCQISANWGILVSGSDRITLDAAGDNWYISGVRSNCDYGEKLKIRVHPAPISSLSPTPEPEPWFPFPSPPTAETPGASWPPPLPFVPVPASSPSSPSSSSSSTPESHAQTPVIPFPLSPLSGSLPPSIVVHPLPWPLPPTAETPGLPLPWPLPFPFPPSPLSSSSASSADTRLLAPSAPSPLPKWGWYTPAPSPATAVARAHIYLHAVKYRPKP